MATIRNILEKAGSNLDESMGVRATDLRPTLAPVPDARDLGRRSLRNVGQVDVNQVVPDPDQPRAEFSEEALDRLAKSIRDHGQLAPIRVRWSKPLGKWVIVVGERRWRATRRAGLEAIDCVFIDGELPRGELLSQQLIENLLREDLRAIEEAKAFQQLMDLNGWTGKQLADALRLPPSKVSRSLALLDLPGDLQERVESGELAARSAYEITKLPRDDSRRALADTVRDRGLTNEDARNAVRAKQGRAAPKGRRGHARFTAPGSVTITVSASRMLTDADLEAALLHALEEVRGRLAPHLVSPRSM